MASPLGRSKSSRILHSQSARQLPTPLNWVLCVKGVLGDSELTEVEFGELYALMGDSMHMQFLVFTSILFAYLVAGHFVGATLTRKVAVSMTTIYCLFMIAPLLQYVVEFFRINSLSKAYLEQYPEGFIIPESHPLGLLITFIPMLLAWIGSFYYVHFQVRSQK